MRTLAFTRPSAAVGAAALVAASAGVLALAHPATARAASACTVESSGPAGDQLTLSVRGCAQYVGYLSTYDVPASWDRDASNPNGPDSSAYPQTRRGAQPVTLTDTPTTYTLDAPDCGFFQWDVSPGQPPTDLVWNEPSRGWPKGQYPVGGGVVTASGSCTPVSPTSTTTSPTTSPTSTTTSPTTSPTSTTSTTSTTTTDTPTVSGTSTTSTTTSSTSSTSTSPSDTPTVSGTSVTSSGAAGGAGGTTPTVLGTSATTAAAGTLAFTGADLRPLAVGAGLLALGVAVVAGTRRRPGSGRRH